jgi:hypothetical protein
MNDLARHNGPDALAYLGVAAGLVALGAVAIGAIAIGRLAIGRATVKRLRVQSLEVGTLTVGRLQVLERPIPEMHAAAAADHPPDAEADTSPPEQNGAVRRAPRRRARKRSPA